jgi:2-polyprenyl-3-methyl-5-hydroxy-6-metoxy-1,4-benzoquinol methylase
MHGGRVAEELTQCTLDDVRESWSRVADDWTAFVRSGVDVHRDRLHGPALLSACGGISGRRVLDIGCGEGWCSREVARRGGGVAAVDISEAMIQRARNHPDQADHPVEYHVMDAVDVHRHPWPRPFDLVTACMSLQSMPDPAGALIAARRVLADTGRLVCSIPHPFTHMLGGRQAALHQGGVLHLRAGEYFKSAPYRIWWDTGRDDEGWWTIRWSRPQSEYAAMLKAAGFVVHDELEPHVTASDAEEHPRLRGAATIPSYLVLVAGPAHPTSTD